MSEADAIRRLAETFDAWTRARRSLRLGMATIEDRREVGRRIMALDNALFDAERMPQTPALASAIKATNQAMVDSPSLLAIAPPIGNA